MPLAGGKIRYMEEYPIARFYRDRSKDLVKSGGEWISSVDLENNIMAHPAVAEATVIGIPHEKWQERPLACVVLKDAYKGKTGRRRSSTFCATKWPNGGSPTT